MYFPLYIEYLMSPDTDFSFQIEMIFFSFFSEIMHERYLAVRETNRAQEILIHFSVTPSCY